MSCFFICYFPQYRAILIHVIILFYRLIDYGSSIPSPSPSPSFPSGTTISQELGITNGSMIRFDFSNASHVSYCTHYDSVEIGETEDKSNAAMTHDALFNAMNELQKEQSNVEVSEYDLMCFLLLVVVALLCLCHAKTKIFFAVNATPTPFVVNFVLLPCVFLFFYLKVPYYEEAKERYADYHAEKEKHSMEEMEGENLQYEYNTFDLDHGNEQYGLNQSTRTSVVPPAPSIATTTSVNPPKDEVDSLVMERLRVEEESFTLRRQLATMKQEMDRLNSKERIQVRLKERREAKRKKKMEGSTTTTAANSGNFYSQLNQRAQVSRDRTASRLASRKGGAATAVKTDSGEEVEKKKIQNELKLRQLSMAKKLKEVEERIACNNVAMTGVLLNTSSTTKGEETKDEVSN